MKNQVKEDIGIDLKTFDKDVEIAKFKNIRPTGWSIAVRLYTQPQKVGSLYMPDSYNDEQKYRNFVGLVVAMADGAYKDEVRYKNTGPWCKVGDWVYFPRHAGYQISFRGMPVYILNDDVISGVLEDPINDITNMTK